MLFIWFPQILSVYRHTHTKRIRCLLQIEQKYRSEIGYEIMNAVQIKAFGIKWVPF